MSFYRHILVLVLAILFLVVLTQRLLPSLLDNLAMNQLAVNAAQIERNLLTDAAPNQQSSPAAISIAENLVAYFEEGQKGAWEVLGLNAFMRGNYHEANRYFSNLKSPDPMVRFWWGESLIRSQDTSAVSQVWGQETIAWLHLTAFRYSQSGNDAEAQQRYRLAVEVEPDNADALIAYANHIASSSPDEALSLIEHSIDLDSSRIESYLVASAILRWHGDYDGALGWCAKAQEVQEQFDGSVFMCIGMTSYFMGEYEVALDNFKSAKSVWSNHADVYFWMGRTEFALGSLDSAETALQHAIQLHSNVAAYHLVLAQVFEAQGDMDSAKKEYQATLEIDSNVQTAKDRLLTLSDK